MTKPTVDIVSHDSMLFITPPVPEIQDNLKFWHMEQKLKPLEVSDGKGGTKTIEVRDGFIGSYQMLWTLSEDGSGMVTHEGLFDRVSILLKEFGYNYEYRRTKKLPEFEFGPHVVGPMWSETDQCFRDMRKEQIEAVIKMLVASGCGQRGGRPGRHGSGGALALLTMATGKTYLIAAIIRAFPNLKILVTTYKSAVVQRLYQGLNEALLHDGIKVGMVTGNVKKFERVTVCTDKSLMNFDPDEIGLILYDECVLSNTEVTLFSGETKKIIDLVPGNDILSHDEYYDLRPDRVKSVTSKGTRHCWRLTLDDGRFLECTGNERLRTDHGWIYLSQILPLEEAVRCPKALAARTAHGAISANGFGNTVGGWINAVACGGRKILCQARSGSGTILSSQGGHLGRLHQYSAENCGEQWVGQPELCVQHRNFLGVRIYTLPMLRPSIQGNWKGQDRGAANQDSDTGMAGSADLGGDCLVVSGRRRQSEWVNSDKHSGVSQRSGRDAGPHTDGARSIGEGETRKRSALPGAVQMDCVDRSRLREGLHQEGQAIHPSQHGIQAGDSAASRNEVQKLSGAVFGGRSDKQELSSLQKNRLPTGSSKAIERQARKNSARKEEESATIKPMLGLQDSVSGLWVPEQKQSNLPQKILQGGGSETGAEKESAYMVFEESGAYSGQALELHDIISIKYIGEQEVWDIETERHHTLFANGLAVHNCHRAGADGTASTLMEFKNAVKFGFTGTLKDLGKKMLVESIFGPVAYEFDDTQAEDLGRVSKVKCYAVDVPEGPPLGDKSDTMQEKYGIWRNRQRNGIIADIAARVPAHLQSIIYVRTIEHIDILVTGVKHAKDPRKDIPPILPPGYEIYHAQLPEKEKRRIEAGIYDGSIKRLVSNSAFSEGVDTTKLRVLINADWTASDTTVSQRGGRNRRLDAGKKIGIIVDLRDNWLELLRREHVARLEKDGFEPNDSDIKEDRFFNKAQQRLARYRQRNWPIVKVSSPALIRFDEIEDEAPETKQQEPFPCPSDSDDT